MFLRHPARDESDKDRDQPGEDAMDKGPGGHRAGELGLPAVADDHDVGSKGAAITDQLGGRGRGSDDCDPADGC